MTSFVSFERRRTIRFPLVQSVSYKVLPRNAEPVAGTGVTVDISSGGLMFVANHEVPVGSRIELTVDWPARIDIRCGLRLFVAGRVIRAKGNRVAVLCLHHEFRTRAIAP